MTTWHEMPLMPEIGNDNLGWDATDVKVMEWPYWMGCHWCQKYGRTHKYGMTTLPLLWMGWH
eukprot:18507-Amphidinium_carterae.1